MANKDLEKLSIYELLILNKSLKNLRTKLMTDESCSLYIPCSYCGYRNLCLMLKANTIRIDYLINEKQKQARYLDKHLND